MATINPPRHFSKTHTKRHELREDQVVTFYARAWDYFDKNRTVVYGAVAAVVLVVVGIVAYVVWQGQRAERAQELLGRIVGQYEAGRFREALDGAEGVPGLLAIADDYGSTDAGNLAHFYAADALFQLGEYDQALEHFEAFDAGENFIGASAIAGRAAVYETREDYARAAGLYREAALHFENELTSPGYLIQAGQNYELAGNFSAARQAYQTIRDRFPESAQAGTVDLYLARVDALAGE